MRHLLLAAAFVATAISAQPMPKWTPPSTDAKTVQAGTYAIEPEHTRVMFGVDHLGFTTYYGEFPGASGKLTIDPARPAAAALDVTIPVDQVWVPSDKLVEELRSKMFFDAAQFPTMRFKSTRVVPTGAGKADVTGNLTMHGVTRPLTLHVKFNGAGAMPMMKGAYAAGFSATGTLRRSDFGVTAGVPMVGDEVKLMIEGAFNKQ